MLDIELVENLAHRFRNGHHVPQVTQVKRGVSRGDPPRHRASVPRPPVRSPRCGTRHPPTAADSCSVRGSLAAQMLTGASLGQDRNKRADGSAGELLPGSVHDVPHRFRLHPGELADQPVDEFLHGAGLIIRSRFHVINPHSEARMEQLPGIARAGRALESMQGSTGSSSRAARRGGQGPWTRPHPSTPNPGTHRSHEATTTRHHLGARSGTPPPRRRAAGMILDRPGGVQRSCWGDGAGPTPTQPQHGSPAAPRRGPRA